MADCSECARLRRALAHAHYRNHAESMGCAGCSEVRDALQPAPQPPACETCPPGCAADCPGRAKPPAESPARCVCNVAWSSPDGACGLCGASRPALPLTVAGESPARCGKCEMLGNLAPCDACHMRAMFPASVAAEGER